MEESLESLREQTLEKDVSEVDISGDSSGFSSDLEDLKGNIYLKRGIISALEEIKDLRSINIVVEKQNRILREQLMNL